MNQFCLDILHSLNDLNKPIVEINDLIDLYDIKSKDFTSAFLYLESEGYIAPINSKHCGLIITLDGLPDWASVPFKITSIGYSLINPAIQPKESFTKWWLKPVIVAISISLILWASSEIYKYYKDINQVHQSNSETLNNDL